MAFLLFSFARVGHACVCPPVSPSTVLKTPIDEADLVFEGKVERVSVFLQKWYMQLHAEVPPLRESPDKIAIVKFRVSKVLKGDPGKYVEVDDGNVGSDCSNLFKKGREYLVYAKKKRKMSQYEPPFEYVTGPCSGTMELKVVEKNTERRKP
ncbi:MAG: hypothetical protein HYX59_13970 [Elusimicrobia bacterium]|nr:hypothetical protein [Elusimicrobiota bacterium]